MIEKTSQWLTGPWKESLKHSMEDFWPDFVSDKKGENYFIMGFMGKRP